MSNQLPDGGLDSMLPQEYFTFQSLYEINSDIKQTVQPWDHAKSVFTSQSSPEKHEQKIGICQGGSVCMLPQKILNI